MTTTPDEEIMSDLDSGYNVSISQKKAKRIKAKIKKQYPNKKLIKLQNYRDTYTLE